MNFPAELELRYLSLLAAANSTTKVGSFTHSLYRYPARFGESFVREAIENFSKRDDTVLDPFCGGGTTLVEALAAGRRGLGSDLSSLAMFVARAKSTPLSSAQLEEVQDWRDCVTATVGDLVGANPDIADVRLSGLKAQHRRLLANLKQSLHAISDPGARRYATALLLKTSQWAFDGKQHVPTPSEYVRQLRLHADVMQVGMCEFTERLRSLGIRKRDLGRFRKLAHAPAAHLTPARFGLATPAADLLVTSPPYLGVHVLYNRWQLQGRKELKAPYYLTDCADAGPPARYTLLPRWSKAHQTYFAEVARAFSAVRRVLRPRAMAIQLVSFADASASLPGYLHAMQSAGFDLCETYLHASGDLSWRAVPGRRWYARVGAAGKSSASQEVLLVHRVRG